MADSILSYNDGELRSFVLWINELSQEHSLNLTSPQSRLNKQHYPRSYAPGDMSVSGQCPSQEDYQRLSLFIREHQQKLIGSPGNYFIKGQVGYDLLLQLDVASERISLKGFISSFKISKKGVFDPAPKYVFNFTPLVDTYDVGNFRISNEIGRYARPKSVDRLEDYYYDDVIETPEPEQEVAYPRIPRHFAGGGG
jgi:hypothetical protein